MKESTKRFCLFPNQGAETRRGVQKKAMRSWTHHSISLDSRSLRSSCTSCRQRSWYSGCFARLYRIQERPLAVVSWPGGIQKDLCLWTASAPQGGQHPHGKAHEEDGEGWGGPGSTGLVPQGLHYQQLLLSSTLWDSQSNVLFKWICLCVFPSRIFLRSNFTLSFKLKWQLQSSQLANQNGNEAHAKSIT